MAEPLKTFFSRDLVRRLAADVARVHPSFPVEAFVGQACDGLEELELLDRGRHIARALADHLPAEYPVALDVLLRSLGPPHSADEVVGVGMAPFYYLPHVVFVAERGLAHFDLSMRAQKELTRRFTAEFSIRAYLEADPERTLAYLRRWAADPDPHVRRLVSEGTRVRLPWAPRVRWLERKPEHVLALLELLRDDPNEMVRRSVANNLNDLGRLRPDLLVRTCEAWLRDAPLDRRALVEHALRSAVKRGEPEALRLLGYGAKPRVSVEGVSVEPARVAIGGSVRISFSLRSGSRAPQELLVDLAVYFRKARGASAPKVFKLKRVTLPPGGSVRLAKRISLAVHTTRVPRPGRHDVDVLVNGEAIRLGAFDVTADGRG